MPRKKVRRVAGDVLDGHELLDVALSDMNPAPYNPRDMDDAARAGLGASIDQFGLLDLIIWNRQTGHIVGGHQRYQHLLAKGETVTTAVVVDWPLDKEKAANIALNNPQIHGHFTDGLKDILSEIRDSDKGLMEDLRFSDLAVELNLDLDSDTAPNSTLQDDPPDPPPTAFSRSGDLWILGNHRILCGDCTNKNDVLRVMNGERADLFATDPPYFVEYDQHSKTPSSMGNRKDWSGLYGKTWDESFDSMDAAPMCHAFLKHGIDHAIKDNAAIYCWHSYSRQMMLQKIWEDLGLIFHQQIIWVKPTAIPTYSTWMIGHECAMHGWIKGNRPKLFSFSSCDGPLSTVWAFGWGDNATSDCPDHPTTKPLEISAQPMRKHTIPGDLCYEPFSGSGSQMIAAEQMDRRCFAIEIEPVFVDVAIRRWCALTDRDAIRDEDGCVFPLGDPAP